MSPFICKTTHSPGLVYRACTSVCTLPTTEWCDYIGLCVLHRVSENNVENMEQVIGQRGMLCQILFDTVASMWSAHVGSWRLLFSLTISIISSILSLVTFRPLGMLATSRIQGQGGKGTCVRTINILKWSVYASVTLKSYRRIAAWSDPICNFSKLWMHMDGFAYRYARMETQQHYWMGAILLTDMDTDERRHSLQDELQYAPLITDFLHSMNIWPMMPLLKLR